MNFLYLLIIILTSLINYNTSFLINVNKHYTSVAAKILNINKLTKIHSNNEQIFKHIYHNNNASICYSFNNKNNAKLLLKDKYNYLVSFDIYKYKYLIIIKSTPISFNETKLDIDIRHNRNIKYNFTSLNFKHYNKINKFIYSYIYNNIIMNNKKETLSYDLFKFFNKY